MKGWTLTDLYSLERYEYEVLVEIFTEYLKEMTKDR